MCILALRHVLTFTSVYLCRFDSLQDKNSMATFLSETGRATAAARLDIVSVAILIITGLMITFIPSYIVPPAHAALTLTCAVAVSSAICTACGTIGKKAFRFGQRS